MTKPSPVTVVWLNQTTKGFSCVNAHRFLSEDELRLIPEDDFGKFLAVPDAKGDTTLHLIANDDDAFRYVAEKRLKFLTPEALNNKNQKNVTPMWNAIWGADGIIPWNKFQKQTRSWIPKLAALQTLRDEYRQGLEDDGVDVKTDQNFAALAKLIERVEKLKKLRGFKAPVTSTRRPPGLKHP
jgi:hypothetical protein